jgi:spore germination protein KA
MFSKQKKQITAEQAPAPEQKKMVNENLTSNIESLKKELGNCSDLIIREFTAGEKKLAIIHIDGISDSQSINQFIVLPLQEMCKAEDDNSTQVKHVMDYFKNDKVAISSIKSATDWQKIMIAILSGDTAIFLDHTKEVILASTRHVEGRSIAEPTTQTLIRGPKDSFTEAIRTNTSLLRMRIKSPKLRIDALQIGEATQTDIAVVYMEGLAEESIVQEIKQRLKSISTDAILDSGYIESFITTDKNFSIFPTVLNTERPDVVAANVLEGRISIFVNGTPFALIVPVTFFQFFQSPEDYYQRYDIASFLRLLRIIAFFIALLIPAIYIALVTQHQGMIPTLFIISIAAQREGVPFPTIVEAIMMELMFELLREAGVRMPRAIGSAASIVGALILGQVAVQAGLVSAPTIIVVSITAIASLSIPYYNIAESARLLRFGLMIIAAYIGLYGIMLALLVLVAYMCQLRSFSIPYLTPIAPFIPNEQKDTFIRVPLPFMFKRPIPSNPLNKERMPRKNGDSNENT